MPDNLPVSAAEPNIGAVLSNNVLLITLSRLEFADLHRVSRLFRDFGRLARWDIWALYAIWPKDKRHGD